MKTGVTYLGMLLNFLKKSTVEIIKFYKIILLAFAIVTISSPAMAAQYSNWNSFLTNAHKYTYYKNDKLISEIKNQEKSIKTSLEEFNKNSLAKIARVSRQHSPSELNRSRMDTTLNSDFYMITAIGQYLEYLKTNERNNLNNSEKIISYLKPSFDVNKKYLYWYYIIKSTADLTDNKHSDFKNDIFELWQQVVIPLKREIKNGLNTPGTFSSDIDYICANIMNIITYKAIIEYHNTDMFSLGPIAVDLAQEFSGNNIYKSMMAFFNSRESDSANINYTVPLLYGLMEADRLDNARQQDEYEETFKNALKFYKFAYNCASTDKGKATVLVKKTVVIAKALASSLNNKNLLDTPYFNQNLLKLSQQTLNDYENLYAKLAIQDGDRKWVLKNNGYQDNPGDYSKTLREMWQNYIILMQWQTEFLKHMATDKASKWAKKNYADQIIFAEKYFNNKGYSDLIPDAAFYSAANCASDIATFFVNEAANHQSSENIMQALYFEAYATMLNPLNINSLVRFTHDIHNNLSQGQNFIDLFTPISKIMAVSIRNSKQDNVYSKHEKELESLASEIGNLYTYLPQTIAYVSGSKGNLCNNAITIANIYSTLIHKDTPPARIAKEFNAILLGKNINNPGMTLVQNMSRDLSKEASKCLRKTTYDFYSLNKQMTSGYDKGLARFLKNLFYNTQKEMETASYSVVNMKKYVINSCEALSSLKQ